MLKRILLILLLQTLFLVALIGFRQWTLNTGTPIILETEPIDPRSLFSGDYVRLRYKISTVLINPAEKKFTRGQKVYVSIKPENNQWAATGIYIKKPKVPSDQIVIKGYIQAILPDNRVQVAYGIENYFVPENEGKKLEQPTLNEKVSVKVSVDRLGNAAISGIFINQKQIYQETLF